MNAVDRIVGVATLAGLAGVAYLLLRRGAGDNPVYSLANSLFSSPGSSIGSDIYDYLHPVAADPLRKPGTEEFRVVGGVPYHLSVGFGNTVWSGTAGLFRRYDFAAGKWIAAAPLSNDVFFSAPKLKTGWLKLRAQGQPWYG